MLQIHRKRTHAEITFDKPRRRIDVLVLAVVAKGIQAALPGLDLDNLRSVGGKQSSCVRAGITGREGQNPNALKYLVGRHGLKTAPRPCSARSEERRVGKELMLRWWGMA